MDVVNVASLVGAQVEMFIVTVLVGLPQEQAGPYLLSIKAAIEANKERIGSSDDVSYGIQELLSLTHATTLAYLASSNVRTANDLTSLLYSVLLEKSGCSDNKSVVDDLERLVGPKATAQILNWFSSYGKDLSALVRPRGAVLN